MKKAKKVKPYVKFWRGSTNVQLVEGLGKDGSADIFCSWPGIGYDSTKHWEKHARLIVKAVNEYMANRATPRGGE